MKIGNVVTDDEFGESELFNVYTDYSMVDNELPTIVIGWDLVKNLGIEFSTINNKLSENLFWTFKLKERKDRHNIEMYLFKEHCYKKIKDNIKYVFIDLIQYNKGKLIKIYRKIYNTQEIYTYKYNNMLYICCDNIIFGYDTKLSDYLGYNTDKIINKIINTSKKFIDNKDIVKNAINYHSSEFKDIKYIPYFMKRSAKPTHRNVGGI